MPVIAYMDHFNEEQDLDPHKRLKVKGRIRILNTESRYRYCTYPICHDETYRENYTGNGYKESSAKVPHLLRPLQLSNNMANRLGLLGHQFDKSPMWLIAVTSTGGF